MYGSCVWNSTSCENINRIYKFQKRAARVILNAARHERSTNLFEQLNWLPLKDEIIMQKSCLLYNCMRGKLQSIYVSSWLRTLDCIPEKLDIPNMV